MTAPLSPATLRRLAEAFSPHRIVDLKNGRPYILVDWPDRATALQELDALLAPYPASSPWRARLGVRVADGAPLPLSLGAGTGHAGGRSARPLRRPQNVEPPGSEVDAGAGGDPGAISGPGGLGGLGAR